MSSDKKSATPKKAELTEREQQVLAASWQCFKTEPEIDTVKLAALVGYTNPRSCTNAMLAIKKKLAVLAEMNGGDAAGGSVNSTPTKAGTKKTPTSRKRKSPDVETGSGAEQGDADVEAPPSVVKKARTPRKPKAKPAKKATSMVDDDIVAATTEAKAEPMEVEDDVVVKDEGDNDGADIEQEGEKETAADGEI
ncbi:hypothetical protein JX266_006778 [Neoarthrinium moseri]|nr:hypothetical protein JX266_006778 [Neoarthrinium moseri]